MFQKNLFLKLKVGLSLSYALNITGAMNMLVRMTSEIETNMVSVERIEEYQTVPQEAPFETPEGNGEPPKEWPQHGVVHFDNYQVMWISFHIKTEKYISFHFSLFCVLCYFPHKMSKIYHHLIKNTHMATDFRSFDIKAKPWIPVCSIFPLFYRTHFN